VDAPTCIYIVTVDFNHTNLECLQLINYMYHEASINFQEQTKQI